MNGLLFQPLSADMVILLGKSLWFGGNANLRFDGNRHIGTHIHTHTSDRPYAEGTSERASELRVCAGRDK